MQFLFAPFWGRLSDHIGRKPILIGSLVGDAVFYTLFGLSTHNIYGQFGARILAGIFSSASLAVAQAYAADITPPHLRAMGMGYIGAAFGFGFVIGFAIGPAIGGMTGQANLAWLLYFSALLALANLVYIVRYLPEPELVVRENASESLTSMTPTSKHTSSQTMPADCARGTGFLEGAVPNFASPGCAPPSQVGMKDSVWGYKDVSQDFLGQVFAKPSPIPCRRTAPRRGSSA